jgi:hypothetical protein
MKAPKLSEITANRPTQTPSRLKSRPERKRPLHVSVYISDAVADEFKQLAIIHRCKPHDLYIRGFDLVLQELRAKTIAEIDGKTEKRENVTPG